MNSETQAALKAKILNQSQNRRTFAIISHPDAGKTTLTEKLLLYSGMLRTAGMVRARKGQKNTSSDWMAMEQERGISITASAMQFQYKGVVINLLDTPGHQDFSEDTYRTLTAADCAVMIIDAAKGVETQTKKLFAVCRKRGVPIMTFINKLDLPGRNALELIHEVEQVLGIGATPINWPIGSGKEFVGVIDCKSNQVLRFERSVQGGAQRARALECDLSQLLDEGFIDHSKNEEIETALLLLSEAGNPFDEKRFLAGELTPVFFGSGLTNFGVEPFFDAFIKLAPAPRETKIINDQNEEELIYPHDTLFSGFVFKIQANMNPRHRDSMAFIRVASGIFRRDMEALHHRSGKVIRLSRSYSMVARDRETVEEAFPGDIVGFINPGAFAIGDTVSALREGKKPAFNFLPMPSFPPEVVARIRPNDVMRRKAFDKGVAQLCDEGAVQLLRGGEAQESNPLVAAVGRLQFDVLQYRLEDEYQVKTELELLPYRYSAWLKGDHKTLKKPRGAFLAFDKLGRVLVLFTSEWEKRYLLEENPGHGLLDF
jgi:peptide chain release factor 3